MALLMVYISSIVSLEIQHNGADIAQVTVLRSMYRVGETITGVVQFDRTSSFRILKVSIAESLCLQYSPLRISLASSSPRSYNLERSYRNYFSRNLLQLVNRLSLICVEFTRNSQWLLQLTPRERHFHLTFRRKRPPPSRSLRRMTVGLEVSTGNCD